MSIWSLKSVPTRHSIIAVPSCSQMSGSYGNFSNIHSKIEKVIRNMRANRTAESLAMRRKDVDWMLYRHGKDASRSGSEYCMLFEWGRSNKSRQNWAHLHRECLFWRNGILLRRERMIRWLISVFISGITFLYSMLSWSLEEVLKRCSVISAPRCSQILDHIRILNNIHSEIGHDLLETWERKEQLKGWPREEWISDNCSQMCSYYSCRLVLCTDKVTVVTMAKKGEHELLLLLASWLDDCS